MHLSYKPAKYKNQRYKSYNIAESYREGGKVKKRILLNIGRLADIQVQQMKFILKISKNIDQVVTQLEDLEVQETKAYLDISLVNDLWNQWELDKAYDYDITNSQLPTNTVAKILTINRCLAPCSHHSIPAWARKNALEEVLKIDLSGLNDDKIYYELDKIAKNKMSIENFLFKQTYKKNPGSYEFVDYDLTTSYFVGYKCKLSAFGKGKIECHGRRQVLLGVMINGEGYPFKWDVFPGNTAEVKTLKRNINACRTRFNLNNKNITLVFDRGIISEENGELIENADMKYISALDRPQISSCGISLKPFKGLLIDKATQTVVPPEGLKKYDEDMYFHDSGVIGNKRFIEGFNPALFVEDRNNRTGKIDFFSSYLKKKNETLRNAKKDRAHDTAKNQIIEELKRLKIKKYYELPVLKPITVRKKLKNGDVKSIKSFQVEIKKKNKEIKADMLLDGVCVFITNHTEKQGRGFKLKPEGIIKAYRNKTKIEDVFKNMKSFLKLRPFFVNTVAHVKAVYTICIQSYFINKYFSNLRKAIGEKDFLNSNEIYAPFKDIDIVTLEDSKTGKIIKKATKLSNGTAALLKKLKISHIVLPSKNKPFSKTCSP